MKKCEWKIKGLYPVSADDAVDVINGCQDESGYISAKAVVDASRSERAILHPCFEWNDGTAAEKWREQQARVMIKNLVVVEVKDDRRCEVSKAFVHVISDSENRGYKQTEIAICDANDREYVLESAKRKLAAFQEKYNQLVELASVMTEISKLLK